MEEETVEDVRNVEGGTKRGSGIPCGQWTPSVDVAKGNGTPWEALRIGRCEAVVARETLERSRSAREDEAGDESYGGRCGSETCEGDTET